MVTGSCWMLVSDSDLRLGEMGEVERDSEWCSNICKGYIVTERRCSGESRRLKVSHAVPSNADPGWGATIHAR